jgi:hypothetical protein
MSEYYQNDLFADPPEKKPVEKPKQEIKSVPKPEPPKSKAWVPQMIDGEWEIY